MTPDHSTPDAIVRTMNAVRSLIRAFRINSRATELQMGLSLAQLFVLEQLREHGAPSLNDLASRTATHQSSVSVVVRRLVERGLVMRQTSQTDRRHVELTLSSAGERVLAHAPPTIQKDLIEALARLTRVDRNRLAGLLDRWIDLAGIQNVDSPMLHEDTNVP